MNTPLDLPLTDSRLSETIMSSPNTSEPISTRPNVDSSAFECRCQAVRVLLSLNLLIRTQLVVGVICDTLILNSKD